MNKRNAVRRHLLAVAPLLATLMITLPPTPGLAASPAGGEKDAVEQDDLVSRAYHLEHMKDRDGVMLAHQTCLDRRGDATACLFDVTGPQWFIYQTDAATQEAIAAVLARHDVASRSLTLRLSLFMADHTQRDLPDLGESEVRALEDLIQLLPYRGFRLLETGWLLAEDRGQIHLGGTPAYVAEFNMIGPVDPDSTTVRMESFELHLLEPVRSSDGQNMDTRPRVILRSSFSMNIGETVVVGTSRLDGEDEALVVLLTASR